MTSDYEVTVKIRNNVFLSKMRDAGYPTLAALSRASGVAQSRCGQLASFKKPPLLKSGVVASDVQKIAETLFCLPEELFPERHYTYENSFKKNVVVRLVNYDELAPMLEQSSSDLDPENLMIEHQTRQAVAAALLTLTPREERVLRKRFGIGCDEMTLAQMEGELGVTSGRLQQIEAKGIRKLKHPTRSGGLLSNTMAAEFKKPKRHLFA